MMKVTKFLPIAFLLPGIASGQTPSLNWFIQLTSDLDTLVDALIPVVIAIGLLFFIWGLVQFIAASGDEAAKDEGKRKMIWGIVALFVIVAVWGLVELLVNVTGVNVGTSFSAPATP